MAQPSTTYKFELNLTDLDRGVYENVRQTIARHPSETEERMAVRLLAYALWYNENLSFGRGLSDVDEAALWEKSLDDRVLHWIEVGQPDAERLTWCSAPLTERSHSSCTSCWPRSSVTNRVPSLIITSHLIARGMSVARVSSTSWGTAAILRFFSPLTASTTLFCHTRRLP